MHVLIFLPLVYIAFHTSFTVSAIALTRNRDRYGRDSLRKSKAYNKDYRYLNRLLCFLFLIFDIILSIYLKMKD